MNIHTANYRVEPFGNDCLGNITGYRVVGGHGYSLEVAAQYSGNIYVPGSFDEAKAKAEAACERLNEPEPVFSQAIGWDEGMGSPSSIVAVFAASFRGLRDAIRSQRWSRDIHSAYDCTGIEFARSAKILHVAKTDSGHSAVLLVTRHFDV